MTHETRNSILSFAAGIGICLILVTLEIGGVDIAGSDRKWFDFALWTAFVFGCVAALYLRDLRKARCVAVFLVSLALHAVILVFYLRRVVAFPNVFFLFFSPFEGAAIGVTLMLFGGAKPHREHRVASRRAADGKSRD